MLQSPDALVGWRDVLKIAHPMDTIGIFHTLLGASIIGKLCISSARSEDVRRKLVAAHLFASPFASKLPHPQRAADFGAYYPKALLSDSSLFIDPFKYDFIQR